MMTIDMMVQQIANQNGWALGQGHSGYRIEVPTEYGRSQVVEMAQGADPDGRPIAYFWSTVCDASMVSDPWYLLSMNAELAYGGLAYREPNIVLMETQLIETADAEEVQRAIYYVATYADQLEKQILGHMDQS